MEPEAIHAIQNIAELHKSGDLTLEQITEQTVSEHLYTADMPDPDLLSEQVAKKGSATCCGKWRIPNCISLMFSGLHSRKETFSKRFKPIRCGNDDLVSKMELCDECQGYLNPALAVDACVRQGDSILLVQRKFPPSVGSWVLPGGFVDRGERPEEAVLRELKEEAG